MRAVVQRVIEAKVSVDRETVGEIGNGLVILLGIGQEDDERDMEYLANKIINLRVFDDENGKMNLSLLDTGGGLLIISQFTLYGDCRKGKRPSFDKAARPQIAEILYWKFIKYCQDFGIKVETGKFQTVMLVEIKNDGPVTLIVDSKKEF